MMHADSFNLGDSMSALEMMDPKMDAGVVNEKNKYVIPANECFDRGLVDLDPDMAKTLMSMDNILALEMTWLRGTAMVQTLFTCLYCQRPAAIKNNTLKVFCHGVMKTTEVATKAASRASVHEEEDLSTNTGGFALCQELTEEEVSASLKAEEELLEQRVKAWKSVASGKGGAEQSSHNGSATNVGDGSASDPMHGQRLEALLARIRLRRGWYAVVCHLSKGFKSMKSARKSIAYSLSQLARVREGVCLYHDDAAGTLCLTASMHVLICPLTGTDTEAAAGAGAPHPALEPAPAPLPAAAAAAASTTNYAFQPKLNLKHMAPSPPRAVRLLSVSEALDELSQLLAHLDTLCARLPLIKNLQQLQHVLADWGASLHPHPGGLPRTFLRICLYADNKILGSQVRLCPLRLHTLVA